jgi:1,2-dihydroxy-3-keto-5-methylthiopentene dioxygenase
MKAYWFDNEAASSSFSGEILRLTVP